MLLITNFIKNFLYGYLVKKNNIIFYIKYNFLFPLVFFLKYNSVIKNYTLIDINVIDFINEKNRFELTYFFINKFNRICLKLAVPINIYILSISSLFNAANWLEREIWDMFGVKILLHPNLRRILTDYGFKGHPLCKNFPLIGFVELNYDNAYKNISINPVEFSQKIRLYKSENPWTAWKK